MKIIGAGLTGMIAAFKFPEAQLYEASPQPTINHSALLRFRTPHVGELVGIPFRKVRVHKGIVVGDNQFVEPNIRLANAYSEKVTGGFLNRSIWDTAPCDRYVAPNDFIQRLQYKLRQRIQYGVTYDFQQRDEPVISTVPMSAVVETLWSEGSLELNEVPTFNRSAIHVLRTKVLGECDVHQTIYFPESTFPVYRASITGDVMIIEAMEPIHLWMVAKVCAAFGVSVFEVEGSTQWATQGYGKIAPIDDKWRRSFIWNLTTERNIFSLGRFATWRNILLDDVIQDCDVVRQLIDSTGYFRAKLMAGK